jgi:hypothetical protein
MKKGLRKILIGSAALFLLIALVAPGISATDTASTASAGTYNPDFTGTYNAVSTSAPSVAITEPVSNPDDDGEAADEEPIPPIPESEPVAEDGAEPESEPAAEGEAEPESEPAAEGEAEPEEALPEIPSEDTNPDEPDSSYPTFKKEKAKYNSQGHGNSGHAKKVR